MSITPRRHRCRTLPVLLILGALAPLPAAAHFQTLIPSTDMVSPETGTEIGIDLRFTHPMANGPVMEMGVPTRFGVLADGEQRDLRATLEPVTVEGRTTYHARYRFKRPADHVFYIEPAPYWEPAEGKMIVHYTKVVVDAFEAGEGWDALVGFPVEIEPLVRPYGLWTGNSFRGIVRRDGEPAPFAEIEVEYLNSDGAVAVPAGPFATQVIRADGNGVFSYTMPRAGWWGFAALVEGTTPMTGPTGESVPVEQGGLIWVRTVDME